MSYIDQQLLHRSINRSEPLQSIQLWKVQKNQTRFNCNLSQLSHWIHEFLGILTCSLSIGIKGCHYIVLCFGDLFLFMALWCNAITVRLVTLNYRILSETGTLSYCIFLLFPPLFSHWRISCSSCNCDFILFSLLILFFLLYCSFPHRYAYKLFIFIFFFFLTCLLIFFSQLQDWNNRRQFTSPSDFHADGVNDFFISQVWSLPTIVL
jgi:hypothetical protein